jgi:hypothetical protein
MLAKSIVKTLSILLLLVDASHFFSTRRKKKHAHE